MQQAGGVKGGGGGLARAGLTRPINTDPDGQSCRWVVEGPSLQCSQVPTQQTFTEETLPLPLSAVPCLCALLLTPFLQGVPEGVLQRELLGTPVWGQLCRRLLPEGHM